MAKYYIHISSTTNVISDPMYFHGTGFMGEGFNNRDELVEIIKKYTRFIKDGKYYSYEEIKFSFDLGETVEAFKAEAERQCKENGEVNLFTAALIYAKDPFKDIEILYRPSEWEDEKGNSFKFILIKDDQIIPKNMKLTEILRELGMEI